MKRFKNILVGVDLSCGDHLVGEELVPPTQEAVQRGLWLAKTNSARLSFVYALEVSLQTQHMLETGAEDGETVLDQARTMMDRLVDQARREGVTAEHQVALGKGWIELIRQVLRAQHDLVVVGTRHLGRVGSVVLGSVGTKLLRKCPCPVWVTQPQPDPRIRSVLVATDLSAVSDLAMELGCSMARLHNSDLHVVHALKHHERDPFTSGRDALQHAQRQRQQAEQQIQDQLDNEALTPQAHLHVLDLPPEIAILEQIEFYDVQLLVMGTVARTGIPGLLMGNTAERLLPRIPCSVLAVKPAGFHSPITLHQ